MDCGLSTSVARRLSSILKQLRYLQFLNLTLNPLADEGITIVVEAISSLPVQVLLTSQASIKTSLTLCVQELHLGE